MMSSDHSLLSIQSLNIDYTELEAQVGQLQDRVEVLTAEIRAIRDREVSYSSLSPYNYLVEEIEFQTALQELPTPPYGNEQSNLELRSLVSAKEVRVLFIRIPEMIARVCDDNGEW